MRRTWRKGSAFPPKIFKLARLRLRMATAPLGEQVYRTGVPINRFKLTFPRPRVETGFDLTGFNEHV